MGWSGWAVVMLVVSAVLFAGGGWACGRRRIFIGLSTALTGILIALGAVIVGLVGANLLVYARLTYERPVAEILVQALDTPRKRYEVAVRPLEYPAEPTICEIQGDEWLLSARVQRWEPWANVIGLDSTYRLEQIANRYSSAKDGHGKPITACDIAGPQLAPITRLVPAKWQEWLLSLLRMEDRRFGSANYMPLADGAAYRVVMTQYGLNAEPLNEAARAANIKAP